MRNFLCPLPTLIGKATKSSPGPCHQSPGKAIQNNDNNKQQQKLQEISSLEYLQPTLNKNPEIKSQRQKKKKIFPNGRSKCWHEIDSLFWSMGKRKNKTPKVQTRTRKSKRKEKEDEGKKILSRYIIMFLMGGKMISGRRGNHDRIDRVEKNSYLKKENGRAGEVGGCTDLRKGDRARARTSSIPVGRFALENSFCFFFHFFGKSLFD